MEANISAGSSWLRFNFKGPGVGVGVGLGKLVAVGDGKVGEAVSVTTAWFGVVVWQAESIRLRVRKSRMAFLLKVLLLFLLVIKNNFSRWITGEHQWYFEPSGS